MAAYRTEQKCHDPMTGHETILWHLHSPALSSSFTLSLHGSISLPASSLSLCLSPFFLPPSLSPSPLSPYLCLPPSLPTYPSLPPLSPSLYPASPSPFLRHLPFPTSPSNLSHLHLSSSHLSLCSIHLAGSVVFVTFQFAASLVSWPLDALNGENIASILSLYFLCYCGSFEELLSVHQAVSDAFIHWSMPPCVEHYVVLIGVLQGNRYCGQSTLWRYPSISRENWKPVPVVSRTKSNTWETMVELSAVKAYDQQLYPLQISLR